MEFLTAVAGTPNEVHPEAAWLAGHQCHQRTASAPLPPVPPVRFGPTSAAESEASPGNLLTRRLHLGLRVLALRAFSG